MIDASLNNMQTLLGWHCHNGWEPHHCVSDPLSSGFQYQNSMAGPRYQLSKQCAFQPFQVMGLLWTTIQRPGGAIGVRLKSYGPNNCDQADSFGLRQELLRRFKVRIVWASKRSQRY